jgi:hypothetical protein
MKNSLASAIRKINAASMRLLCLVPFLKKSIPERIKPCNAPSKINISKKPDMVENNLKPSDLRSIKKE